MDVEKRLRDHYARETLRCAPDARALDCEKERLALAMAAAMGEPPARSEAYAEYAPARDAREVLAFTAAQVSFVDARIWAAQAVLAAGMAAACLTQDDALLCAAAFLTGTIAAMAGLPAVLAAKAFNTAELEYSCRFDCKAAAFARMLTVGCAQAAVLLVSAFALPALVQADAFSVLAHAAAPFFTTCAGALLIARKASRDAALALACLWGALVLGGSVVMLAAMPGLHAVISSWAWGAASLAAFAFALAQAHAWIAAAGLGLDAFCGACRPPARQSALL